MMKKVLSILLAVLTVFGCLAVGAYAEDAQPEEPVKTDSGYYVGQRIKAGEEIKSVHDTCAMLTVSYFISRDDTEFISSKMQKQYADPSFVGVVSFRDIAANFTEGDRYKGVYPVKGIGDTVDEMEVLNGTYKSGSEIYNSMSKEEKKKIKDEIVLSIDYAHSKTTLIQYTTFAEWEIFGVIETENSLNIRLQAVYETREPEGVEPVLEQLYSKWLAFLDVVGDYLIPIVPELLHRLAKLLGN